MIYLDNNATTAPDPFVLEMIHELNFMPLNPSSPHHFGRKARELLEWSRKKAQNSLEITGGKSVFCSGGTEALSIAIYTLIKQYPGHIITSACEHPAVLRIVHDLQSKNIPLSIVSPGPDGILTEQSIIKHAREDTSLIISLSANHETGLLTDIYEISKLALKYNWHLIVDAIAHWGRYPFVVFPGISAVCISAHKFHGIKGAGLCHFTERASINTLKNKGQEWGLRPGTENIPAIVGMAKAMEICSNNICEIEKNLKKLSEKLLENLNENLPEITCNGSGEKTHHTISLHIPQIDAEIAMIELDTAKIAISLGAACGSWTRKPSNVLFGMGYKEDYIRHCIRISLSRFNTEEDIQQFCKAIKESISKCI